LNEGSDADARKRAVSGACNLQQQLAVHLIPEAKSADDGTTGLILHEITQGGWNAAIGYRVPTGLSVGEEKDVDL
jgi:hypothetical protein